jgi:hypothetical protein
MLPQRGSLMRDAESRYLQLELALLISQYLSHFE